MPTIWNCLPRGGLAVLLAAAAIGCGGGISDPPAEVQEAAREALQRRTVLKPGTTPRIEPERPSVMAQSPQIHPLQEQSLQKAASDALARIGPPAVPQVLALLKDPDPEVRIRAALILARIGPEASVAVPELTAMLNDDNEQVRKVAARALGQIGPLSAPAVPALIRAAAEGT